MKELPEFHLKLLIFIHEGWSHLQTSFTEFAPHILLHYVRHTWHNRIPRLFGLEYLEFCYLNCNYRYDYEHDTIFLFIHLLICLCEIAFYIQNELTFLRVDSLFWLRSSSVVFFSSLASRFCSFCATFSMLTCTFLNGPLNII